MSLRQIFLLLFSFLNFSITFAQTPTPRILTAADFLGNRGNFHVFDIETDTNGAVYFTGPNGFSYSNGHSLKVNWKKKNNEDVNIYFSIHKDFNNELWLSGPLGIAHVKADSLIEIPIPDSLEKKWSSGYESIYRDRSNILHVAPRNRGHYTIDSSGKIEIKMGQETGINGFVVDRLPDGKFFHYYIYSPEIEKMSLYILNDNDELIKVATSNDFRAQYQSSFVQQQDSSFYFSPGNNEIFHFKANGELIKTHQFPYKIIGLFIDSQSKLWIGTVDNGFFKVNDLNLRDYENYWSGASAVVAETRDGGLWFKSDPDGFGYIPPLQIPHYSEQNGYPKLSETYIINGNNKQVLTVNTDNELILIENDSIISIPHPAGIHKEGVAQSDTMIRSLCYDNAMNILISYSDKVYRWNGKNWTNITPLSDSLIIENILRLSSQKNGRIIGMTKHELFEVVDNHIVKISETKPEQIQNFTLDDSGKIWVAGYDGLWIIENENFIRPFENLPEELMKHNTALFYYNNAIWVQPIIGGLYRINGEQIDLICDQFGNQLKIFNYSISPDNKLWVTIQENGKLCNVIEKEGKVNCNYYEFNDVARANIYTRNLYVTDKLVYWATRYGLFVEQIDRLKTKQKSPGINFVELRINHEIVPIKNRYDLAYNRNYINITYEAINYRKFPTLYSYEMEGIDTLWTETEYINVQYTNLDPGNYSFKLRTKVNGDSWGEPKTISFTISKPYWETWWFITLCIFAIILLGYLIIILRVRQVRRREKNKAAIKVELARLELKALRAQINPHFIFNSITSVLSYLSKNNNEKAEEYLQRFARLIRQVLENSDKQYVSLKEELELMREYIILESEHYEGEKIQFNTKFNTTIIDNLKIPPTLLQPYIENAVRHGLKTKAGDREIIVKVDETDSTVKITIQDNGIGRIAAAKNNLRSNHRSMGIFISSQRIELMNKKEVDVTINDLTNEQGEGIGTQVIFFIPSALESIVA